MALVERTFPCVKDVWIVDQGENGSGNGRGPRFTVGRVRPAGKGEPRSRTLLEFDPNFNGIVAVESAYLRLSVNDPPCINQGSNPMFLVEQLDGGFQEGEFGDDCSWSKTNGGKWPGPDSITTNRVLFDPAGQSPQGRRVKINLTAMVRAWFEGETPNAPIRLRLIASNAIPEYDEFDFAKTITFCSRQSNWGKPALEVTVDDDHPPGPPTILSPTTYHEGASDEGPALIDGLAMTIDYRRKDEDPGDYITGTEIQVYTESAEQDEEGIVTGGSLVGGLTGTGQILQLGHLGPGVIRTTRTVSGFLPGQRVRFRLRTRDKDKKWGLNSGEGHGWSELTTGWVDLNQRPAAPTNLYVTDTLSPTPDYQGTHVDPDPGSAVGEVQTQVVKQTVAGVEMIQNSTSFTPTTPGGQRGDEQFDNTSYSTRTGTGGETVPGGIAWTVPHDGRELVVGERVYRRHRTVDQFGRVGAFSPWVTWLVGKVTSPGAIPAPGVKQNTLTPYVGARHTVNFDRVNLRAWTAQTGGALLWDTGQQTVSPAATTWQRLWASVGTVAGGNQPLRWGQQVWVERQVREVTGSVWTSWSPREPMPINSLPTAPQVTIQGAILRPGAVWLVTTRTPRILLGFRDADLPAETCTRWILRIINAATGVDALYYDTGAVPAGAPAFHDVAAGQLAWETVYRVHLRMADSSGALSPLSPTIIMRVHQAPTATLLTVPIPADPTPLVDWVPTFYGGAKQAYVDFEILDVTAGFDKVVATRFGSAAGQYTLPPDLLEHAHSYYLNMAIYDTLGASVVPEMETDLPASARFTLGGATMAAAATVTTPPPTDQFSRTVAAGGWGTSPVGGPWTINQGSPSYYSVNGAEGLIAIPSNYTMATLQSFNAADVDARMRFRVDRLPVDHRYLVALHLRWVNSQTYYKSEVFINADSVEVQLGAAYSGGSSGFGSADYGTGPLVPGEWHWLRFQCFGGPPATVRTRLWKDGDTEPSTWLRETTNDTVALRGAGAIGIRGAVVVAADGPALLSYDDLEVTLL